MLANHCVELLSQHLYAGIERKPIPDIFTKKPKMVGFIQKGGDIPPGYPFRPCMPKIRPPF
jgi:hypothetical protein